MNFRARTSVKINIHQRRKKGREQDIILKFEGNAKKGNKVNSRFKLHKHHILDYNLVNYNKSKSSDLHSSRKKEEIHTKNIKIT